MFRAAFVLQALNVWLHSLSRGIMFFRKKFISLVFDMWYVNLSSLRLNGVREFYLSRDPARHGPPCPDWKSVTLLQRWSLFYLCIDWAGTSHIDRPAAKLHVFSSFKSAKKHYANILKRFPKRNEDTIFQTLLRIMYPIYQLCMLIHGQPFTIYRYPMWLLTIQVSMLHIIILYST